MKWYAAFTLAVSSFFLSPFSLASEALLAQVIEEATENLRLHETQKWLNLLHYKPTLFGMESQNDGLIFFIDQKEGKWDPRKELIATLKQIPWKAQDPRFEPLRAPYRLGNEAEEKKRVWHIQCRFPARFRFLEKKLKLIERGLTVRMECPAFKTYLATLNAESATLVFSSYFINNPASAFGHSFLRINRKANERTGKRAELLDWGVNYAANVDTGNPFIYAIAGVTGGFDGVFSLLPYYFKVREYNDHEARDLWEYDLNLSKDQVAELVEHIWELQQTTFDYFYFTENCSYHMLTILDAVEPSLNLASRSPYIAIPADTVRVVVDTPALVDGLDYRPSVRSEFYSHLKTLDQEERDLLDLVLATGSDPKAFAQDESHPAMTRIRVLDAAADYYDFRYSKEVSKPESKAAKLKSQVLIARSRIPIVSPPRRIESPDEEIPHLGHASRRLSASVGLGGELGPYLSLGFRGALQDLLDPVWGYPPGYQIEFFHPKVRMYLDGERYFIEHFRLLTITSLAPLERYYFGLSWRMNTVLEWMRSENCRRCHAGGIDGGAGLTVSPFKELLLFALLETDIKLSPSFYGSFFHPSVGPALGIRLSIIPNLNFLAKGNYYYTFFQPYPIDYKASAALRFGLLDLLAFEARAEFRKTEGLEYSVSAFYYF